MQFIRKGDTLVVTRIDRLARSIADLQDIIRELKAKGATLEATEQPINTSTSTGKMFVDLLGVFAEFETNLRKERQMEGVARASTQMDFQADGSVSLLGQPINDAELRQEFWVTVVEADDLGELGTIPRLMLDDLAPDFDLAEQKRPMSSLSIAVVVPATDQIPKRIDAVSSYIPRGWLVGVPNIVSHEYAVQQIVASAYPVCLNDLPCPIRNDLAYTDALVPERPRKFIVVARRHWQHHGCYATRWGSGFLTGGVGFGALFGGGGVTGSLVGDTGSSSGITVYLLVGSPIWPMASSLPDQHRFHASLSPSSTGGGGMPFWDR
jgi:Resolvase, N terminal domain